MNATTGISELTYGQKLIAEAIEVHFGEQPAVEDERPLDDDTTLFDVWEEFDRLSALAASPAPVEPEVVAGYGEFTPITVAASTTIRPAVTALPVTDAMREALERIRDYAGKPHADRYVISNMAEKALEVALSVQEPSPLAPALVVDAEMRVRAAKVRDRFQTLFANGEISDEVDSLVAEMLEITAAALSESANAGGEQPAPMVGGWQRKTALMGWVEVDSESLDHYRANGHEIRPYYLSPAPKDVSGALREAAQALVDTRSSTFTARNGRTVGIQDDSGEKCWIVPFDEMAALERALSQEPAPSAGEES